MCVCVILFVDKYDCIFVNIYIYIYIYIYNKFIISNTISVG